MSMKRCLQIPAWGSCSSSAFLFVRVVMGVAFILHGWGKIQSPFSWMPPGAPIPGFFQFLAALSEFGGGIALILGFMTRLAGAGLAFTMLVAASMHAFVMKDPFVNLTGGSSYELALLYCSIAVMFLVIGPGKFSLDRLVFGEKEDQ